MKTTSNKKKPAWIGTILILAGIAFIISGCVLYISIRQKDKAAAESALAAAQKLHAVIPEETEPLPTAEPQPGKDTITDSKEDSEKETKESSSGTSSSQTVPEEEETVTVDGTSWLGLLSFTGYGLELPVLAEFNFDDLQIAPARYSGSVLTKDLVIAAHNYEAHFSLLNDIGYGEEVVFTDASGRRFYYTVALSEVLDPTAYTEMTAGEWDLTLFTCTYGGQTRRAVRCDLVSPQISTDLLRSAGELITGD